MDNYYIKENGTWSGPMSESTFEARKRRSDVLVYWTPEFCPNHVLHPHLCEHSKTWEKPPVIIKEPEKAPEQKSIVDTESGEEPLKKQVILQAEPLAEEDQPEEKRKQGPPTSPPAQKNAPSETNDKPTSHSPGFAFKLVIIIVGFILVIGAGFYVNSKLSVMFYQDLIIRESVKNIEFYTRDMRDNTKENKKTIDTLNVVLTREIKNLKIKIRDLEAEMDEIKPGQ